MINITEIEKNLKGFTLLLKEKELNENQIQEILGDFITTILQSSFNKTLEEIEKLDNQKVQQILKRSGINDPKEDTKNKVLESFFEISAEYLSKEKVQEIIRKGTENNIANFIKLIK